MTAYIKHLTTLLTCNATIAEMAARKFATRCLPRDVAQIRQAA